MKFILYIRDKLVFIVANMILFIFISLMMVMSNVGLNYICMLFMVWFLPLMIYICIEYFKLKKFYSNIYGIFDRLDKKYLLPEVLEAAKFEEGRVLIDILSILSKNMHENINH